MVLTSQNNNSGTRKFERKRKSVELNWIDGKMREGIIDASTGVPFAHCMIILG